MLLSELIANTKTLHGDITMNKILFEIKNIGGCLYRPFNKWINSADFRKRARYAKFYNKKGLKNNIVLYESFFGRGMICNPYAIFLQLLQNPAYKRLKHVWVLDNIENHSVLLEEYSGYSNVIFVQRESKQYLKYLCSAKYLINNVTFPSYFAKKPGQIYLNTWHGIPMKHVGYDVPQGNIDVSNIVRNFLHTDYLSAANSFMVDNYNNAFKMREIYKGGIIEEGYPRLDLLNHFSREEVYLQLQKIGVEIEPSKKIILFAPTWRGISYSDANANIDIYKDFKHQLEKLIDTNNYQILIKVHQRVFELAREELTDGFFIPATIDANVVLGVTDILISDFSSIYFDFLATERPVLFYIEDLEQYQQQRGMYFKLDDLPGPYTDSLSTLSDWINRIDDVKKQYTERYDKLRDWSNSICNENISQKTIDIVFEGLESEYRVIRQKKEKKHILINRGWILVNGISTSFINLLNCIDYEQYDVSAMVCDAKTEAEKKLVSQINPKARVLYRNSTYNATLLQEVVRMYRQRHHKFKPGFSLYCQDFYRSYGNTDFDYAIDFEGYNFHYANLTLQCPGAIKSIWQHNDMAIESESRFPWLTNYFCLYQYFDNVISCSQALMEINRKHFANIYAPYDAFKYAKNCVDPQDVHQKKMYLEKRLYEGATYIMANEIKQGGCITGKLIPYIPPKDDNNQCNYRFVTVGRLSPEKNHENLIYAFNKLFYENSHIYLYILGDGLLREQLQNLIQTLGLDENIVITGNVENPISIMKNCDCFILPSINEGQPMVIHEARLLQMPIICSRFSSADGVCINNGQFMIDTTQKDIYKGMKAFINGKVSANYVFNGMKYNEEAINEFVHAIT